MDKAQQERDQLREQLQNIFTALAGVSGLVGS
jgi:hypothetical protein